MEIPDSTALSRRLPRVLTAFFTLWLLATASAAAQTHARTEGLALVPVPEWVRPTDIDIPAAAAVAEDIYGLAQVLQDAQGNFNGEQDELYQHMVFGLRSRMAVEAFSVFNVAWHSKTQSLAFHTLRVWRERETIDLSGAALVQIAGQSMELPEAQASDASTMSIIMPDLRTGDIVEIEMTTRGSAPGLEGTRQIAAATASALPTSHFRFRLLDGPRQPVALHVRGGDLDFVTNEAGGIRERLVALDDIAGLTAEADAPAWYRAAPVLTTTAFTSWDGVLGWAMPLFSTGGEVAPDVAEFAHRLISGQDDEMARFSAIAAFVQDRIRYLGPGLSRNGYVPFVPSDVLRRRWGDCKDKVMLALAMLDAVGIRAWAALTNIGDGYIDPEIPAVGAFDHVVLIAEVAGQTVWLDATGRAIGENRPSLEQAATNLALPVRPGAAELIAPPPGTTNDEGFHVDMRAEFDLRGGTEARFTVTYAGLRADSVRQMIEQSGPGAIGAYYFGEFKSSGKDMALDGDAKVTEGELRNLITVSQGLRAASLWQKERGTKFRIFRSVPGRMGQFLPGLPDADRKAPLALAAPLVVRERHVLTLPDDMSLDEFSKVIDREAYHLSYSWERDDNVLTLTTVYRAHRDHLLPEEVETWRMDREAFRDWSYTVWTNPPGPDEAEPFEAAEPSR